MKLISFQISGRYGHFLRAEGGASAPTYPVPPRTVILGLIGAVLGMNKDQPQVLLEPANIALSGRLPQMHWHRAKFRQDSIEHLPKIIGNKLKGRKQSGIELPKRIGQEWLFNPSYTVWVSVPAPYFVDLERRLIGKRWHFQPSLGLSEMMAELTYLETDEVRPLAGGSCYVNSVFPHENGTLDMDRIFEDELVIHSLRMPRTVTPDRVFSHANYFMERDARPVPVETGHAFKVNNKVLMFL